MIMRSGIRSAFTTRAPRTVRKAPASFRPALEALEDRTVLDSTLPVGGGQPINMSQPSLALSYIISVSGVFPPRDGSVAQDEPYVGEVLLFAGNFAPEGWDFCNGQLLPIDQYAALFSILGTTYGGNGTTNFALPNLQGRAAVDAGAGPGLPNVALGQQYGAESTTLSLTQVPQHAAPLADGGSTGVTGGGQPVNIQKPSQGLTYIIAEQGIYPSRGSGGGNVPLLGEIRLFAGNFAPGGWALCNGQLLSIAQNAALFSVLGTTYGGNGTTNFALPDLQGRNPIGTGQESGLSNVVLGQDVGNASVTLSVSQLPVHDYPLPPNGNQTTGSVGGGGAFANDQPALGLNYIITLQGVYPARDPEPMLGDIRLFAGNFAPSGFALCQGQLLSIAENTALFSILGTTYGGNGVSTFALPDLRGRAAVESGQGSGLSPYVEGEVFGQDSIQLTVNQLPSESLPLPVLALSVTADKATVNAGGTAGFTVTVNNTGPSPSVAAAATLSDPLPALGGGNLWSINTHAPGTNPGEFKLVGTAGNQVLELIAGAALASNIPQAVDVTGVTTPSGSPTATLTTTATLDSPDVTVRNLTGSATITVISQQPAFAGLSSATITYGTPTTTLTGNLTAGGSVVAGATVSITINSVVQTTTTNSSGDFNTTFNTATLGVASVPYTVTYAFAGNSTLSPATDTSTTLTVTTATLTVTADNDSKTYGQTVTFTGTEFTDSGLINRDSLTSVTLTSAGAVATATVAGSPYKIVPSDAVGFGLGNYTINYVNGELTVTAAYISGATIFGNTTPTNTSQPDPHAVELGIKFESSVAGYITGIRFYKGAGNTGTHVGYLWTNTGTLLASATFTNETASGWQQVNFSAPVGIAAGTIYIASYLAPSGYYADDQNDFASSGVTNGPLTALSNSAAGGNGVYLYGLSGGFPMSTYESSNYYVDVVFTTQPSPPTVTAMTPASGAMGVSAPNITATFSEPVQSGTISFTLQDPNHNIVPSTLYYNPSTYTATLTPIGALTASTTYTVAVSGAEDAAGNALASPVSWLFTTASTVYITNATIFGNTTPVDPSAGDAHAVELGVKFESSVAGYITGVRFYKGPGNTGTHVGYLWTDTGTLLAMATFTNETVSGWQQVDFSTPVAIAAGTTYVASYLAPSGHYADDQSDFASSGVTTGPLTALSNTAAGGNGVYLYGLSGGFPTDTYESSNYYVDVVFTNQPSPPAVTSITPAAGATGDSTNIAALDTILAAWSQSDSSKNRISKIIRG